jgi:phage recombination protein Bet
VSTTTDIARRPNGAPATTQSSAVAIRTGQVEFDDRQKAALVAMGVSEKVTRAELAVFFHQCRTLRLDPFSKQIYLIHRRAKEGDRWVEKPTTQVGIDGFRVTRDRIAQERDLAISYEDTLWYNADNQTFDVWLWDEPPTACKFVVLIDDGRRTRRFPSVLRFNEYCQFGREDDKGDRPRLGRWRDGHSHQIEKCAEADALRRAFPNDLSGVILEDAAPLSDPDAPAERQRVTAEQARARAPQRQQVQSEPVDAVVVDEAPWPGDAAPAPQAVQRDGDPRNGLLLHFQRLGVTSTPGVLEHAGQLLGTAPPASLDAVPREDVERLIAMLAGCQSRADLDALLADGTAPGGE